MRAQALLTHLRNNHGCTDGRGNVPANAWGTKTCTVRHARPAGEEAGRALCVAELPGWQRMWSRRHHHKAHRNPQGLGVIKGEHCRRLTVIPAVALHFLLHCINFGSRQAAALPSYNILYDTNAASLLKHSI